MSQSIFHPFEACEFSISSAGIRPFDKLRADSGVYSCTAFAAVFAGRTALPCTCSDRSGARQYRPIGDSLSEQKYRQHGYQDRDRSERQKPSSDRSGVRPAKTDHFGPRPLQLAATHSVSRCGQCGTLLASLPDPVGKCLKCGFELHSCKQCTYFDPASRFECTQPIRERIARKDQLNSCTFYSISVRVEKQTSTPLSARPADAKQAFENLFKK